MIKPTIGRVVWFWEGIHEESDQAQAALVTYVHSDTCVNLSVFDPNGNQHARTSVLLKQEPDDIANYQGPYCEWMPYQKGQAAKTEALEAASKAA